MGKAEDLRLKVDALLREALEARDGEARTKALGKAIYWNQLAEREARAEAREERPRRYGG